ncbi:MAG: 50S ribosomal protein L33 [Bacteroidales bacterium]|jgi:large subunit ribosomal protein L33|nr:50S ribosomal protein L33 [Bacteroidales bacterium]MBO6222722.1 50S ribosomal protein L33 [Bacteroidales bacterium]MBO7561752.1 50S ribosomal protein L33 [Bacteroidales bacterium]MBP5390631.1 50S ribosomal protein L33 [Bacteroidales bacterium]MBP5517409.1 50S ribosomal protein L33 [Bacteroidales bacterium]
MAKKENRVQVILECTEQRESGVPGMSRYITTKNKKNTNQRLERKKYNPYLKRVTLHREVK